MSAPRQKNLINGRVIDQTFRSGGEGGPLARYAGKKTCNTSYGPRATGYCFMDNESYEDIYLTAEQLGDGKDFLQEDLYLKVLYYKDQPYHR